MYFNNWLFYTQLLPQYQLGWTFKDGSKWEWTLFDQNMQISTFYFQKCQFHYNQHHRSSTELQKTMYSIIAYDVKWTFKFCWDSQCLLHLYCRHPATVCQSIMATNIQSVRKRKERTDQQPTFSRVKTFTVFGLPLHNGMLIKLICDLLSTFLIETTENNKSSFPTCIKKTQAWQAGGG